MSVQFLLVGAFNAGIFDLFMGMYCVLLLWSRSHDVSKPMANSSSST